MNYYVPEGVRCYADNVNMPGVWEGTESYYYSDDAVNSALGICESDPAVINAGTQVSCRIRNCVRWQTISFERPDP